MRILSVSLLLATSVFLIFSCTDDPVSPDPIPLSDPPTGRLYSMSQTDSLMTIIDTKTFTVLEQFTMPVARPHYLCFEPSGQHYYVVSLEQNGRISKFAAANNAFVKSVSLNGVFPSSIAITNDNMFAYVSDFTDKSLFSKPNFVYKINVNTMTLVDSIPDGATSHDLKITSDGKWVIVSNRDNERVTMIDTQTDQNFVVHIDPDSIYTISDELKYGPFGIAIDHRDSLAFIACMPGDQIRVLDIAQKKIVDSIFTPHEHSNNGVHGPTLMAVSPDNDVIFVSTQWSNRVIAVRVSTREVIETHRFDIDRPFGVTMSADGNRIYANCANFINSTGWVFAIDGVNQRIVDSLPLGLNPNGLIWRP